MKSNGSFRRVLGRLLVKRRAFESVSVHLAHMVVALAVMVTVAESARCQDERAKYRDSYKYYGPQGLWKTWTDEQKLGRDTWIFWTWGNQNFLRDGARLGGSLPAPVSLDLFRALDSRNRDTRFARLGLINEPNFYKASSPDKYGLWLDVWKGDEYYPGTGSYDSYYPGTEEEAATEHYGLAKTSDGRGTGIVGLRLFDNPKFDPAKWDVRAYFKSPGRVEPPYLVGFSCAFCHIAFDPTNPPDDPESPRWENLAANIGNQYFREGDLFLGNGRVIFGDRNPGPHYDADPYDTEGLGPNDFLLHYATTQQPGTSETSRISYDFINNPNTMNSIFRLASRPTFEEIAPNGQARKVMHVLKDGADSVGLDWALMRVPINIGCEGAYWGSRLFNPANGRKQHPYRIAEVLAGLPEAERAKLTEQYGIRFDDVSPKRLAELRAQFGTRFGRDWQEAWRRKDALAQYLMSYDGFSLADAPKGKERITSDNSVLERGRRVFAEKCATCHSSAQPDSGLSQAEKIDFYVEHLSGEKLRQNFLSDDRRYSAVELGTNLARAMATNAIDGDVWAEFSSKNYKALDPVGRVRLTQRPFLDADAVTVDYEPPGGGRGYYRTPTLISIWATAPFLHNNALGLYNGRTDVEGRLEAFEDACQKLLWPEKREMYIKRTSAPSSLLPDLTGQLPKLAAKKISEAITKHLEDRIPKTAAQKIGDHLEVVLEREIAKSLADRDEHLAKLRHAVEQAIGVHVDGVLNTLGLSPSLQAAIKEELIKQAREEAVSLGRTLSLDLFTLPKGTPINLYANLNLSAIGYAGLAQISATKDRRQLAEMLLSISDCPDLVEDKGHEYGAELSDVDKRALIEFLKTL